VVQQPITETKPEAVLVPRVVPIVKKEDVKVEEKKDVVVQPQTKSETKTEAVPSTSAEVKKEQPKESVDLFGTRLLKEDAYVYKEANEKSQRTWLLKKGTELTIISPGPEGWHLVRDAEKRKGFVKQDVLTNKQQ
jgi:Zn-dependent metalloprotease